jgi:hypothetical protein
MSRHFQTSLRITSLLGAAKGMCRGPPFQNLNANGALNTRGETINSLDFPKCRRDNEFQLTFRNNESGVRDSWAASGCSRGLERFLILIHSEAFSPCKLKWKRV